MEVGVHVTCMHINFDGCGHSGFGDIATFKNGQISLSDHGLIVHSHQKIQLFGISSKKIMQVEVNVLSMHTNFDGCRHSSFGDIATFKNGQISLSNHGQRCC